MVLKDKTQVIFHSGILTIGGTVIEVRYNDDHIFFDFGSEYRPELDLPDEQIQTLLKYRLIPQLNDVYDKRFELASTANQQFKHTAVFLSHAHLDHSKMINFLDCAIPLYALKPTADILKSLNRDGAFLLPSPFNEPNYTREITPLQPNSKIQIGQIEVEIVPVDHDAYGAAALLIRTPDKFLVYTGDLRLHGFDYELTEQFIHKAQHPDMLMMEGVSISFDDKPKQPEIATEQELIEKFKNLITHDSQRQITFNGYPANIKRFVKFIEATAKAGRTLVLEAQMAALLKDITNLDIPYYYIDHNNIPSLDANLKMDYDELIQDETNYVIQISPNQIPTLKGGGLYIHSDAQPLGPFDPYYDIFLQQLHNQKVEFVRLAVSGHATPTDLDKIIAGIEPKLLVPIHTLKPEKLKNPFGERILPTRGQIITL